MSGGGEHSLVAPFLTDDPVFALGVEFGLVYARLRRRPRRFRDYVHRGNEDRLLVLAGRLGYRVVRRRPWDAHWMYLFLRREDGDG